ncbi:MFS transporter [Nonomuraea soli]|uniref:MFS family permease n=1 Tax=Nonomuraea soli TaxID=1032476 RepID=A0A7W0CMX3_9ACTN|nr:MFS transporter [Nonomuraea soli]MBA2894045.1 MFS family permease [Nonomuraea soli]
MSRTANVALAAMTVSFGLNFSMGVFFAPTASAYGIGASALSLAAAASTALTGLVQWRIGRLLDLVGARAVLAVGLILSSGSYLALSVVRQTWEFVVTYMVLGGLGFAASSSLTITTLISRSYGTRASPALARAAIGINLGQVLAPWAATALFEPVGVRGAYAILGALSLVVTAVLWFMLPPDRVRDAVAPRNAPRNASPGGEAAAGRGKVLVSFGLHAATMYVVVLMLPRHALETGWTVVGAGRLVAVVAIAAGLTSAVVARLLRTHRPETLLRVLYGVRALALLLAVSIPGQEVLVAVAVLFGAASFPVIPLTMAIMSRGLEPGRIGRTLAPAWVTHQLAAASGLGVAALIHSLTGGYRGYFLLGLAFSIAAAVLLTPDRKPVFTS